MTIVTAAKLGARWMKWWIEQQECDCEAGHICGLQERVIELQEIERAIKKAEEPERPHMAPNGKCQTDGCHCT